MNPILYYKDKTILITGASNGLGKQFSIDLSKMGAKVINIDREHLDLNNTKDIPIYLNELAKNHKIDIVILNAGVTGVFDLSMKNLEKNLEILNVNFTANLVMASWFSDYFRAKKSGHIVSISSIGQGRGIPGVVGYFSSKSALSVMMEGLRNEFYKDGFQNIHTTVIHPGFISTKMATGEHLKHSFVVSVEKASRMILEQIAKKATDFSFPFPMRILTFFNRMLPNWLYDFFLKSTTR